MIVEAALVLSLVLMMLLGVMEYGRYFMTAQLINNAAATGARYAVTHVNSITIGGTTYGSNTSDVQNAINSVLAGITLSGQSTSIYTSDALGNNLGSWNSASAGQFITVQISGNYIPSVLTLLGMPSSLPISVKATKIVESQ